MSLLTTIAAFVAALGTLIVFHELGHYLVAKWCNVKVLRFSIGFGKPLFSRRMGRDSTEWVLAAVPLGGYVKMLDEREGEVAVHEIARAFNRQSVYRRFAIVAAGPLANFLLAIALYWLVFMHGMPGMKPVVGSIAPASAAAIAGLISGEIIVSVDNEKVQTWQEARWLLLKRAVARQQIRLEMHNLRGEITWRTLDTSGLDAAQLDGDFLATLGILRQSDPMPAVLGVLSPGGAAQRAGLLEGDQVISMDGKAVRDWNELVSEIRERPGAEVRFDIRRGSSLVKDVPVKLDSDEDRGRRIGRAGIRNPYYVESRYGALASLRHALHTTWDTSLFSLRMLGKMIVGEVSIKNLSGPITIADYAGQSAQVGWISYLTFLALISISLGVLNLLPIPLLDGGHLLYYMFEIVKGSPVSDQVMEIGQRIGMGVLLLLMACALYNDIVRLIHG